MLQVQKQGLGSELTLRLVHDISPEYCSSSDDDDEETLAVQRETFLLSCLAQSNINNNNNNSITHVTQTTCGRTCDRSATITDTYTKLEWNQHHLEQINNHINEQHLNKTLEDPNHCINLINNNFLQFPQYDADSGSDKENKNPLPTTHSTRSTGRRAPRRPRKLPDIPKKQATQLTLPLRPKLPEINEKCLADELQEALMRSDNCDTSDDTDDVFMPNTTASTLPKVYPKYSGNFLEDLKNVRFNSVSKNTRAYLNSDNMYLKEDSTEAEASDANSARASVSSGRGRKGSNGGEEPKKTGHCLPATNYQDLVVTHRGMHRFIPRHKDEMAIEIGDPLHVNKTGDDLWCEGVNLRSNQAGIFPSMYATDLEFLEEEETDEGLSKFYLRFLGSVEVNYHKGDEILCQAINKESEREISSMGDQNVVNTALFKLYLRHFTRPSTVALSRREMKSSIPPPICIIEVSQYGVRMFDKSKSGHENLDSFTHFFALKNLTFCGHHPRNERYFGFITKHPHEYRYACHVFLGEKSTRSVTEAMGQAFKRFYQEYMAFTHPTEDIYME